jgi:hypothetical protein
MKKIILLFFLISCSYAYGQIQQFNCSLLREIIFNIENQRELIEANKKIEGKYSMNEENGKFEIQVKELYKKDAFLDSILKLSNIVEIIEVSNDSIFYLNDEIILIDTFRFFTSKCNCKINTRKISVINNLSKLSNSNNNNFITISSLDNYRGYSCIFLKDSRSEEKVYRVAFLYVIEHNRYIIKDIVVLRKDMIDYDFEDK